MGWGSRTLRTQATQRLASTKARTDTLRTTLANSATTSTTADRLARLQAISTATYPMHEDPALRQLSSEEEEALEAYVGRHLELTVPPTFLSSTATALKRAALLTFHHEHVEASLIADVPANDRLGRHISRQSILRELVAGNTTDEAGKRRMKLFIKDAQRNTFDGAHTLTVVFMSLRAAKAWDDCVFRLRGQRILFNLVGAQLSGIHSPSQFARNYALRVLGTEDINAVRIIQLMEDVTKARVLDIRYPGALGMALPDNDYWTVIFAGMSCPNDL
ncbi:unnamed protein product [Phytophthora fragariaefolia]|uniref:Unnamed protein product n=1 Tax=Phytophthora fragariaefolia TaxID=1490495 RepID=A0A9W6XLZ7_9STRA|nr:unnamed protein product [Phytophthora fragariaefolia]